MYVCDVCMCMYVCQVPTGSNMSENLTHNTPREKEMCKNFRAVGLALCFMSAEHACYFCLLGFVGFSWRGDVMIPSRPEGGLRPRTMV